MFELAPFYWLLAALLATAAWRNARERRFVQACFWAVLALQFAGGDWVIAARKTGNPFPAQLAGVGVIALAVLALRMRARTSRKRARTTPRLGTTSRPSPAVAGLADPAGDAAGGGVRPEVSPSATCVSSAKAARP